MSEPPFVLSVLRRTATLAAAGTVAASFGLGAVSPPAVAGPALVGQWRFDESDGQVAVDDGPQGLNGLFGAVDGADAADPERIEGASGRALRFDGSALVRLPDTAAFAVESLSTEAVVRADASPGSWRYLVSRGGRGCFAGSYGLYTAVAGGVAVYVFDGTKYVVSATARPADVWDGAWHHVAGTFDGRKLRLFVDGRPVGDPMLAPLRIQYAGVSTNASFGQYVGDCGLSFRGDMDLVRLWSGARSPEAIAGAAGAPPGAGSRPLPAAAPGAVIGGGDAARQPPGASRSRACVVQVLSRHRRGGRLTVMRVRVTAGGRPLRRTRVAVRRAGRRKALARAQTDAAGRARLAVYSRRAGRVTITAPGRPRCTPAYVLVKGPHRGR